MAPVAPVEARIEQVADLVREQPGRTRRAIRAGMVGRHELKMEAIELAIRAGRIHVETVRTMTQGGFYRTDDGLFPGPGERASVDEDDPLPGASLRNWRSERRVDQGSLARLLGVSLGLVQRWERRAAPSWVRGELETLAHVRHDPPSRSTRARRRSATADSVMQPGDLQELMLRAGWTGRDLARAMQVSPMTVSGWTTGRKPLAGEQAAQVRKQLEHGAAELRRTVLDVVRDDPGITREELTRGRLGRSAHVFRELERLLSLGEIREASTLRMTSSGVAKTVRGLYVEEQQPAGTLSGGELERVRRSAGLSRPALGKRLGVSATQIGHWESGAQRIPRARVRQIRELELSETRDPLAGPTFHSDACLEELVVDVVRDHPGLPRRRTAELLPGDVKRRWRAIDAALAAARIYEAPTPIRYADGRKFTRPALFPGPPPGHPGHVDPRTAERRKAAADDQDL